MASYSLFIKPGAAKELEGLPRRDRLRIVARIRSLAAQPRPTGSEKLSGEDRLRVRQGDYRVIYGVDDSQRTVVVFKVGHRREVYR